jgi:hypothetical protein
MSQVRHARWRGTAIAAIAVLVAQLIFAFVAQPFGPAIKSVLWVLGFTAVYGGCLASYDAVRAVRVNTQRRREK